MVSFLLLCGLVALFFIAKRYLAMRREHRLRENPPKRRVIEVSLPRGIDDSDNRMRKFYRKASNIAQADKKLREQGLRQVDIVFLAEMPHGHTMVEVRFLVYADEDKMDAVKRSIKQVFDGMAQVIELQDDPMAEIAAQLKPPPVHAKATPDAAPAPGPEADEDDEDREDDEPDDEPDDEADE